MEEVLKITDKYGFIYEVKVKYTPHQGFSMAYYNNNTIADCQLGRINEPYSDNDREWEMYEERYSEWRDEINVNLKYKCENYFNQKK